MKKRLIVVLAAALFLVYAGVPAALADVTVERFVKSSGIKGFGASESTDVDKFSGLRKRSVSSGKMTGAIGSFFSKVAGGMESDSITDIGKDAIWRLDHKKKTYTESKITLPKEAREEPANRQEEAKEEKSKVRVVKSEISVKETGESKKINGFDCVRYVITWLVETENTETKERSKNVMTTDLWNTPETKETKALQQEEMEFNRAYLKKLGIDISSEDSQKLGLSVAAGLFGGDNKSMEKNLKELKEQMAKVKGFSIANSVKWESQSEGGAQPAAAQAEQSNKSGGTDLAKGIGSFLGGLAKKTNTGGENKGSSGGGVLFESYSEIKRIDAFSIPASEYEVPASYKLAK